MSNVVLTKTQFWSMISLGAITLAYLVYSSFDFQGQQDRAIIKRDIGRVLGNISDVDQQQTDLSRGANELLQELKEQETAREIRSNVSQNNLSNLTQGLYNFTQTNEEQRQNQSKVLLPIFYRSFNQTDMMLNATLEMLNATKQMQYFIDFIGSSFDAEYLIDEVRQYKQSNSTFGNLTITQEKLDRILNLLNATR